MGLTQIDLINQIYYFLLRFLRFLRDTPLPLADCADAAERYMGLTQIDLIKQIYYFFRDFRESLFHIAAGVGCIRYAPTMPTTPSRRCRRWRRKSL